MAHISAMALALALALPVAGLAGGAKPDKKPSAIVPASLLSEAQKSSGKLFDVIVQGKANKISAEIGVKVSSKTALTVDSSDGVKTKFRSIVGVSASLRGEQIVDLASDDGILSITPNSTVKAMGYEDSTMWRDSADVAILDNSFDPNTGVITGPAPQAPTIAIVDSGVDARPDFGTRLVASVNLCSLCAPGATGDDEGHGTMVAGVAAGSGNYPGAAQNARIIAIRTANANGESRMSDVIAAADWIAEHAKQYNIRVANFSLAGATETSFRVDPLDKAVESLWFSGIVVVAAAGNHGSATGPVSMSYAPGNDPFVITVGATDQHMTADPGDDTIPAWSAYGSTMDGFHKPDISAPGRYMIGPVPPNALIPVTVPDRVLEPGYMWMSGTSFASPVVAGAAAQLLARHPGFTPDQVKGALMLTANYLGSVTQAAGGVGEVDAGVASTVVSPPNPNEGFQRFIVTNPVTGVRSFDAASWNAYVQTDASWSAASWSDASWGEASWNAASWSDASWNAASWNASVDTMMTTLASYSESTFSP